MPNKNRFGNTENWIPCDDGLHLIQLDENMSHYGWVFRKVEGGWPYSVRKATPQEMTHAKARQHLRKGAEQVAAQWQPAVQRLIQLKQDRTKRVYIAGPMTGLPDFNFPAFNAMAATMRAEGWHVENPAEHGHVDGAEWGDYLRYDIGRLATCEAVMLLPGWSKSRGACLEVSIARQLDMPIMLAEGAEAAEHPLDEPVAYQIRRKTDRPESQWTPWRECCETTRAMHSHEVGRFNQHGIMREIRPVFTHADSGEASKWRNEAHRFNLEVERLRQRMLSYEEIAEGHANACAEALTKLVEAQALLREWVTTGDPWRKQSPELVQKTYSALSAIAEPSAPVVRDESEFAATKGFALVPQSMLLSKEVIGAINFHCGDTDQEEGGQFGQYQDGRLWIGNVTDDDGNQVHGLHIMTDEYPEEGSTTLVEFPEARAALDRKA